MKVELGKRYKLVDGRVTGPMKVNTRLGPVGPIHFWRI